MCLSVCLSLCRSVYVSVQYITEKKKKKKKNAQADCDEISRICQRLYKEQLIKRRYSGLLCIDPGFYGYR